MASIMDIFNPQVSQKDDTVTVTYCHDLYSGSCTYKLVTLQGKKLRQEIELLVSSDMDDILECLYKMGEITGPDCFDKIKGEIINHSLLQVQSRNK
jgi:hypothetical protein